jgi:hypothetical protein
MLFAYFLVVHQNLNSTFSPINFLNQLHVYNVSVFTTTESVWSPDKDTYRSVIEVPRDVLTQDSSVWTIEGTPKPWVYQLSPSLGHSMYQGLVSTFERHAPRGVMSSGYQPSALYCPAFDSQYSLRPIPIPSFDSVHSHTPETVVERICSTSETRTSVLSVGHPFEARYSIHDLHDKRQAVLQITYRAKQHNLATYILHRSCYFHHVSLVESTRFESSNHF